MVILMTSGLVNIRTHELFCILLALLCLLVVVVGLVVVIVVAVVVAVVAVAGGGGVTVAAAVVGLVVAVAEGVVVVAVTTMLRARTRIASQMGKLHDKTGFPHCCRQATPCSKYQAEMDDIFAVPAGKFPQS
ncbi:hypothetical protein ElyMa_000403700 [Elysia marginata]|uniref:Uncharacterized protein n=1 Tax=Elysia marginata TaxID=1093978 RepID=A0AAV4FIX6_9GAST|nr:hypothetical protein ElyMa_000403700 [Elysia marginata]